MGLFSTIGTVVGGAFGPAGSAIGGALGGAIDGNQVRKQKKSDALNAGLNTRRAAEKGGYHPLEYLRATGGAGHDYGSPFSLAPSTGGYLDAMSIQQNKAADEALMTKAHGLEMQRLETERARFVLPGAGNAAAQVQSAAARAAETAEENLAPNGQPYDTVQEVVNGHYRTANGEDVVIPIAADPEEIVAGWAVNKYGEWQRLKRNWEQNPAQTAGNMARGFADTLAGIVDAPFKLTERAVQSFADNNRRSEPVQGNSMGYEVWKAQNNQFSMLR